MEGTSSAPCQHGFAISSTVYMLTSLYGTSMEGTSSAPCFENSSQSGKDYPFSRAPWPQVTAMYPRIICQVRMRSLPYRIINFMRLEFTLFLPQRL